ncbi:MAG TPA: phage tail protein [Polyangiaceae bacterium]|nr:phage tail protein [Polyangiaceae bacterium]
MAKFTANPQRFDPYRNFKFRVKIDNRYVAGLSKCSALKKTTEKVDWYESGQPATPHKLPGKTNYSEITLTAGVTHDKTFEDWAKLVNNFRGDAAMSLRKFRKDIVIDVFNEADQIVLSYQIFRCWVSEYQALAELDAAANAVILQTIKLENEGWERDESVEEPVET